MAIGPATAQDQSQADASPQAAATQQLSQQPAPSYPPSPDQGGPIPQTSQPAAPPEHRSLMGDLASTIFHVFAGNPIATVDPQTGAIKAANLTSAQKFENLAHGAIRGAAAGAAQRGPGSVGRSALAGIQANDEAAQVQKENLLKQSQNVRETNDAQQKQMLNHASLLKSQQDLAEGSLRIKLTNDTLAKTYADNANQLSSIESQPGAEVLGTFKTTDEFSKFLNEHPDTTSLAKDFAQKKVITIPLAEGGFKAVKVPVDFLDRKTTDDFTTKEVNQVQGKYGKWDYKVTDHTIPSGSVTEGQRLQLISNSNTEMMKAQEGADKRAENKANVAEKSAAATKDYAEARKANVEAAALINSSQADPFGSTSTLPTKELLKRQDNFQKDVVNKAYDNEKFYNLSNQVYKEYRDAAAQGKDLPTGAQSMLLLSQHLATTFGTVKGSRVTKDMIQEHLHARGISDDAVTAVRGLIDGDRLSPGQWEAFHDLIGKSRNVTWGDAVSNAKNQQLPINFLPRGNGQDMIDKNTAHLYVDAANGDLNKAAVAMKKQGWVLPQQ